MEYAGVIITLVGSLIAIAVAWGDMRARNEESRKEAQSADTARKAEIAALDLRMKELTSKEHCIMKHGYLDQTLADIKSQLKDIMALLKDMSDR
jgi:hypothetical protein